MKYTESAALSAFQENRLSFAICRFQMCNYRSAIRCFFTDVLLKLGNIAGQPNCSGFSIKDASGGSSPASPTG